MTDGSLPPTGWLWDVSEGPDGEHLWLWTKARSTGRVSATPVAYRSPFRVVPPAAERAALRRILSADMRVAAVEERTERLSLFDPRPRRSLLVTPTSYGVRRALARTVDALGGFHRFTLYDVDLAPAQLYYLEHGLYPFAPVAGDAPALVPTEPATAIDYELPPIRIARLAVEVDGHGPERIAHPSGRITRITLGTTVFDGPEETVLRAFVDELARSDPDLLLTERGDAFDLPWLVRRTRALGWAPEALALGRRFGGPRLRRAARSFTTYGRVVYRSAVYDVAGRWVLDRTNSFLYDDAGVAGLVDAARLARLSLGVVARQSPGTCFTAMEIATALEAGVHVPWKKNRPERFRTGESLVRADRGGAILQPPVGVHDAVDEFDFVSLYPAIMVRHNLSAETLDCRCCPTSSYVAPGVGYRSCERTVGLLPRTLRPLLDRRRAYKAALRRPDLTPEERARTVGRVKMLKWILVTAFGYQGYRNARFGRIECHEAINAYARDLSPDLACAAEDAGYRVVHGIVDSLWLRPVGPTCADAPEEFAQQMSARFGLPLGYEGRYRWIVFLPAVGHGFGVPNRYYGLYADGSWKRRGIGSRRHDTPRLLVRLEEELLDALRPARDARAFLARLPIALARADRFAALVADGRWPVEELLLEHRVAQAEGAFVTFTDTVAALRQLARRGVRREPGETVRYVLLDRTARSPDARVRVAELLTGDESYDRSAYLDLLARTVETLFAPFGVRRADLRVRWGVPTAARGPRFRSAERTGQRVLRRLVPV